MSNAKKADTPKNFKGVTVILSASDRIGYNRGDLINYVMADGRIGPPIWEDMRYEVIFIKDVTTDDIELMKEEYKTGANKRPTAKRAHRYNIDHASVTNKKVWTKEESIAIVESKYVSNQHYPGKKIIA